MRKGKKPKKDNRIYKKVDNSVHLEKSRFRQQMMKRMDVEPIILETHGGAGIMFEHCYKFVKQGVVIEMDGKKAEGLVGQRPNWSVYEGDSTQVLKAGAGAHLPINYIDADPYGAAFNVIEAFFKTDRPHPEKISLVVHDGLVIRLSRFGGWDLPVLRQFVPRFGDAGLAENYLTICKEIVESYANPIGYDVANFGGIRSNNGHTHFFAELKTDSPTL